MSLLIDAAKGGTPLTSSLETNDDFNWRPVNGGNVRFIKIVDHIMPDTVGRGLLFADLIR